MDQEENSYYIEENVENESRDEWFKKALLVLIFIAVLGGTIYYTVLSNKNKTITAQKEAVVQDLHVVEKPPGQKDSKVADVKDAKVADVNKTVNRDKVVIIQNKDVINQKPEQPVFKSSGIRPSDKTLAAKEALLTAGKADPFSSDKTEYVFPIKSFLPKYIGKNPVPTLPSLKGIPNINSLPNLNVPNLTNGKAPQIATQFNPEVKGFIGNKVIISINGVSESLKTNQSFQGIKVLKVDPSTMTVKYIQDKQVITKNIQSLN